MERLLAAAEEERTSHCPPLGVVRVRTLRCQGTNIPPMTKEKVTLTLDSQRLAELRSVAGSRSLSASVDVALGAHLVRLRHLAAVDRWLAEMEGSDGPIPAEAQEWAAVVVADWEGRRSQGQSWAG